jgi:hypothetical protein
MLRTSGVKTPDFQGLFGTAEEATEKGLKPFPQGLKPNESQEFNVGAEAPTPKTPESFRKLWPLRRSPRRSGQAG